tara:strand:- start:132 stop:1328 length:1197 start_codon:yes stop_codon:yes gene_type:complete
MPDALELVIETSIQQLCDWIEAGETNATIASLERTYCAAMLNKLPLTCKALSEKAMQDERFAALLFYERTRLGAPNSGHFLEGLAGGLPLFTGHVTIELPDDDLRKLRLRDVISDRIRTIANLENLSNDSEKLVELTAANKINDLPPGLPGRVHIFVARMRAICQGLKRVKTSSDFSQCQNRECNRAFYIGQPLETWQELNTQPNGKKGEMDYWALAAGASCIKCEQRSFCTWSCCEQWKWQLSSALPPVDRPTMEVDTGCRKEGRARVPEALRLTLKRNESASRHMRYIAKEQRTFPAVSKGDIDKERKRRVKMYNVDTGLLYAASLLADSATLSMGRILPGLSEGWRSRPMFYTRALREVGKLYASNRVAKDSIICSTFTDEPFLQKLNNKKKGLF